ncbi:MAG: YfiM family protein [Microscillaceae bacterium]|jgi:uncharacterized protein YfiM (DUF2279 family)|nr:YfiM family protein [Microscillaceae bacterium]
MCNKKTWLLGLWAIFWTLEVLAQASPDSLQNAWQPKPRYHFQDTTQIKPKRLKTLLVGGSAVYISAMTGLYFVWYGDEATTKFHFFDDNQEWKQVDKIGHFYTAFNISRASAKGFKWAGMSNRKAHFWGMITGIALMTPIEIFDGFSPTYGASWGDLVANTSGAALLYGQYALWNEMRIQPKFSFHRTGFAPMRPQLLGKGLAQEFLKDYNGQTYWLSFDMDKFLPKRKFPKWLNLAVGYGAGNMIFAEDSENLRVGLDSYRQYYLGIDFDLTAIRTQNKLVKALIYLVDNIRFPAPALEYNRINGWRWHWLYF